MLFKSVKQIRAERLNELRASFRTNKEMAEAIGMKPQRLGALLKGPEYKVIGYELARKIELQLSLEPNYLDFDSNSDESGYVELIATLKRLQMSPAKAASVLSGIAELHLHQ